MMRATGVQYCRDCIIREGDEIPGTVGCIPGTGDERRSAVPKRAVLRSLREDSLLEYGQGIKVYGSPTDLCISLVLRLHESGSRLFVATENTGRTGWDCKLLSGFSN